MKTSRGTPRLAFLYLINYTQGMVSPFQEAYQKLNPLQKKVVDTIDGPMMVIAGPGTGKTQVLTVRIANILKQTDTSPGSILALTFTESGAHTMRQRLIQYLGTDAYKVRIETFHAFCDDVIRNFPEYFPLPLHSQPLSDIEKFQAFEQLLQTLPLTSLKTINSPFHYLKPVMKAISDLKREGISVARYQQLVKEEEELFQSEKSELKKTALTKREKELAKMKEIGVLFQQYQELLTQQKRYDYDDMICFVVEAFQQSAELLAEYQEKFLYILVDEYQDTNAAQNKVVDLLASYWGEAANVCVVGDPHQSIYRFQGASLENTLGFLHRYPNATVVTLRNGYRSPQSVYDAAAAVIQHNPPLEKEVGQLSSQVLESLNEGLNKPLLSQQNEQVKKAVEVVALPTEQHEQMFLVQQVQHLLKTGVDAQEVAVLYRNNTDSVDLQDVFAKHGISVAVELKRDILQAEVIQHLFLLLRSILQIRSGVDGPELASLLFAPWWQLEKLTVMKVLRAAGKTNNTVYERIAQGYVELIKLQETKDLTPLDFQTLEDFFERLRTWAIDEPNTPFGYWFEGVLETSGFLEWLTRQPNRVELLEYVNALLRFVRQLTAGGSRLDLNEFLHIVATMQEHQLAVPVDTTVLQTTGVTFSTTHKAKGREWEYVFIMQCVDGKWGGSKASRSLPLPAGVLEFDLSAPESTADDDRRLFYVALTRAKKKVTISYPETVMSGQHTKQVLESISIHEIPDSEKKVVHQEFSESETTQFLEKIVTPTPLVDWNEKEKAWLQQLVQEMSLSVSALNTYLRSPQEFLARYLLKMPQRLDARLAYGTAMHAALEKIYREWLEQHKLPIEGEVQVYFSQILEKQGLPSTEFELRKTKGFQTLHDYLQRPIEQSQPVFLEKFFGYGSSTTILEDVRLTGRIDRADWLDQNLKTVRVFDYKTGRSKTLNEIDGKVGTSEYSERELQLPEAIRGPLKRQLLFYKLLCQLDASFVGDVQSGVFEFIDPDTSTGKYVTRELPLLDEDVELLKELILEVMKEIRSLSFLTSNS